MKHLAVVNACRHLPRDVVSRPMPELPLLQYYLFHLDKALPPVARELRKCLLEGADTSKTPSRR